MEVEELVELRNTYLTLTWEQIHLQKQLVLMNCQRRVEFLYVKEQREIEMISYKKNQQNRVEETVIAS